MPKTRKRGPRRPDRSPTARFLFTSVSDVHVVEADRSPPCQFGDRLCASSQWLEQLYQGRLVKVPGPVERGGLEALISDVRVGPELDEPLRKRQIALLGGDV